MEESTIIPEKATFSYSHQTVSFDLETLLQSAKGKICHCQHEDANPNWVFCKPKLLPLKTFTVQKLEKLQKEAEEKLLNTNLLNE